MRSFFLGEGAFAGFLPITFSAATSGRVMLFLRFMDALQHFFRQFISGLGVLGRVLHRRRVQFYMNFTYTIRMMKLLVVSFSSFRSFNFTCSLKGLGGRCGDFKFSGASSTLYLFVFPVIYADHLRLRGY